MENQDTPVQQFMNELLKFHSKMSADQAIWELLKRKGDFKRLEKEYTDKLQDDAYDKGFKDGNQRDLTGSSIEHL